MMRVEGFNNVTQINRVNNVAKTQSTQQVKGNDSLEISQFAKDYQTAKLALERVPDVREDKISELKTQIDDGTYEVSASDFADKIIAKLHEL